MRPLMRFCEEALCGPAGQIYVNMLRDDRTVIGVSPCALEHYCFTFDNCEPLNELNKGDPARGRP